MSARFLTGTLLSALGVQTVACGGKAQQDGGDDAGGSSNAAGTSSGAVAGSEATAGTAGSGGGGGSALPMPQFPCDAAMPLGDGHPGYEQCGEGGPVYRAAAEACPSELPRLSVPNSTEFDMCHSDLDCTEHPHGYCQYACNYGCVVDSDCEAGWICRCGTPVGRCIQATCAVDADCEPGLRCQGYEGLTTIIQVSDNVTCGIERFACQSSDDTCGSNADCAAGGLCNADSGHFECRQPAGDCTAIGRPFLVDGAARVADLEQRADWSHDVVLDVERLSPELRAAAAEGWASVALLEHASIAAFARFSLQLLSFGAPPELIELATRAIADETVHARLAFAIASQLGGKPCGPGPLDMALALDGGSLTEVTRLVFREGCVGETIAALSAREAAAHVTDPQLRQVLSRIADDETRHAELAWRFLRWALAEQPSLHHVVEQELAFAQRAPAEGVVALSARVVGPEPEALASLGILPAGLEREVRATVLREVIAPCVAALLCSRADRAASASSAPRSPAARLHRATLR